MPGHNTVADTETQELGFNGLTHNIHHPSLLADFYTQDSSATHAIKKLLQSVIRTKEMSTESNSSQFRNRTSFSCNTAYTSRKTCLNFKRSWNHWLWSTQWPNSRKSYIHAVDVAPLRSRACCLRGLRGAICVSACEHKPIKIMNSYLTIAASIM